jgi:hypothetical protein
MEPPSYFCGEVIMFDRPGALLKLEEIAILVTGVLIYRQLHYSWVLFAILFFVPDIFMVGFWVNARVGAFIYNAGHALFVPLALLGLGYLVGSGRLVAIGLIWVCHIAFDRALGFGLKYPTGFGNTHLQRV